MLLLAIETATISCSVALMEDDCIVAEITTQYNKNHSSTLMPNIEQLFKLSNKNKNNLDVIAVSFGPGSFTGLRIGITTAKTLSYALNAKLILVPTLAVIAAACYTSDEYIMPIIDAQQEKVYSALYRWVNGELKLVEEVSIVPLAEIHEWVKSLKIKSNIIITGEVGVLRENTKEILLNNNCFIAKGNNTLPVARNTAFLAKHKYVLGEVDDCAQAKPFYIRKSAAEEKLSKKNR